MLFAWPFWLKVIGHHFVSHLSQTYVYLNNVISSANNTINTKSIGHFTWVEK